MPISDARLHEIGGLVEASGHAFDPVTGLFRPTPRAAGRAAPGMNPASLLPALAGVSAEELRHFTGWRSRLADDEFIGRLADALSARPTHPADVP